MNQKQQQQKMSSGLTRYRSAPSSYFASLLNSSGDGFGDDDFDQLFGPQASSPDTHRVFSRFMDSVDNSDQNRSSHMSMQPQSQSVKNVTETQQPQQELQRQHSSDYSSVSQMMYQSQSQPGYNPEAATSDMDNSYGRFVDSINSDRENQMKMSGSNTDLIRHSSSPAGFFSNINIENGMGNFGANAEASTSTGSTFKGRMRFSSRNPSSDIMIPISEMESTWMRETSPGDEHSEDDGSNNVGYITGFPATSWDDSAFMSNNFLKGIQDNDSKMFLNQNGSDNQNTEDHHRRTMLLSHHPSLPKSSATEMLMQDSVPCKIRAKRGCATHPRSIAERVRRTRISERIRKLQELVPNMDKQTNTADMLDLAVDYIKDLQNQVKTLSDNRENCTCSNVQKP